MMQLDERDVWPDDVPVGTFDIYLGGTEGYPASTAHILFVCPNGKRCGVMLGPQHVGRPAPDKQVIWGWDGNREYPTITPSINCVGGCGWHGHITSGEFR